jgi:hypothetical protein
MKWATAFIALTAVARFTGSNYFLILILGLAPQALRFRPLRGLGAQM